MFSVEKLLNDLYEILVRLRYPCLAESFSRDRLEIVLAQENRLFLLSWLLSQTSEIKDEEISKKPEESKIIKWYSGMGICNNSEIIMGRVPLQDQIYFFNNLLLFMKNILCFDESKGSDRDDRSDEDFYKKCIFENVDIVPTTLGLNKKLSYNEAINYLNTCGESLQEKSNVPDKLTETKRNDLSLSEAFGSVSNNSSRASNECDKKECVENFVKSFENISSWPKLESDDSPSTPVDSLDNCINNIHSEMTSLKETFRSKFEMSNSATMDQLEKREMPLDYPIRDIVIAIEELNRLQIIE